AYKKLLKDVLRRADTTETVFCNKCLNYLLSTLYFPGPVNIMTKNTKINIKGFSATPQPSPAAVWCIYATIIVNINKKEAGLCHNPKIMRRPPTSSIAIAMKPQNTGRKLMPKYPIEPPTPSQVLGPPISLGYP